MINISDWEATLDEVWITGDDRGRAYVHVEGDTLRIDGAWDPDTQTFLLDESDFIL